MLTSRLLACIEIRRTAILNRNFPLCRFANGYGIDHDTGLQFKISTILCVDRQAKFQTDCGAGTVSRRDANVVGGIEKEPLSSQKRRNTAPFSALFG